MPQQRRLRGGSVKGYNSDLCDDCDSATLKHNGGSSKVSQGTHKSDSENRNDDKENLFDERRVLLAITVEIEDGCVEHIQLKEGDSAEAVAVQFCQDHALPEQFVAPLTEHIVSNIISISKEDSDIVFQSQEEHMSNDENWTLHGSAPYSPALNGSNVVNALHKPRDYGVRQNLTAETNALLARREVRTPPLLQASQKVNRSQGSCRVTGDGKPRRKTRQKKRRGFSDRLLAPTITSLAKCGALDKNQKKPRCLRTRPLSEQAKAVCMRLYTEVIRHEHRCMDEAKRSKDLYQENVTRKQFLSKKSWRMTRMRGKIAKQYKNYGELLYAEGITMRQNHLKAVSDKKQQDERKEVAELTLKPKISKRARNLRRSRGQIWSRLQSDDRPKQDQLQELRQEVWEAKLMECTFKPQINQTRKDSQDQISDDYRNCFEQLFLDAESRRRRRAEWMQWYPEGVTFQPSINRGLPYGMSLMDDDWQPERSVFRRLLDNASKVMEKKQAQEKWSHRPFDQRTGRELFKPLTGRKPYNRNPVHLPIGEYLHRMKCAFDSKIRGLNAREYKIKKENAKGQFVGPNSQRLLERLRARGFKQVFDFLDTNKDGYVDLTTTNFDRLNHDLIEDLNRLKRMAPEGTAKNLDYGRFEDLMLKAETKYHVGQQVHLGLKHKTHYSDDNCTFQFKMDRLSRNLAKTRRKFSTHEQWWEIIIAEFLARQQKVESWRKDKQQEEMLECTFMPYLKAGRLKKGPPAGVEMKCTESLSFGETINDLTERVQQEVYGFYFQNEQGGPELLGMPTPGTPASLGRPSSGRKGYILAAPDVVTQLDDLPKTKTGLFFGVMGA